MMKGEKNKNKIEKNKKMRRKQKRRRTSRGNSFLKNGRERFNRINKVLVKENGNQEKKESFTL